MKTIFKLLGTRLVIKTEELFKLLNQKPMMSDPYLYSVVFIDFEKLKPTKKLDGEIYVQIMLLYVKGWLQEYLDEMQDENEKNQYISLLLCWFFKFLVGVTPIEIKDDTEFAPLQLYVNNIISEKRITENKKRIINQMGRSNAACDKDEDETDTSLVMILNEWMQFKSLK